VQADNSPNKWLALVGLSLLSFTAFLDYTIVATALPFIQKDLNATVLQLQWVMNIYGMILCMFMIAAGQAGDLFGRKTIYFTGFILFGIAALGAGGASSIEWLISFRAIQGFAAAIIFTVGVALLPQAFPAQEQTRAIGIFSAFNGAGLAVGPFLGGLLITFLSWRWVFWINIPLIVFGLLLCMPHLKPSPRPDYKIKIDWLGLLLLIVGLGSLVYGIIFGEQTGWDHSLTWTFIGTGVVALLLLIAVENRVAQPLLDFSLFRNSHATLAMLVCSAAGFITFVFMFFDPLYLEIIRKQGAFMVGIILLSVPAIQVIISLLFEKLVKKTGVFNLILYALLAALLAAICHVLFTSSINMLFVIFALMLMGYTWGIANVGSISAIAQSVKPEKLGGAIGTVFTFWNISGSIFLALTSVIFHWRESDALFTGLAKANVAMTPEQQQQIQGLISDPQHAQVVITQYFSGKAGDIYQLFESSFMAGFHAVAWFAIVIMVIIFLAALALSKK